MAELAAPIIHEDAALIDADIEIQWCRGRLADPDSGRADARNRLAELLDRVAKAEARTLRGAAIKLQHSNGSAQDQAQKAELRALAEALAADNSAPLPDGDAGLIEAERRHRESRRRRHALHDRFNIDLEVENEIMGGIIDPSQEALADLSRQPRH